MINPLSEDSAPTLEELLTPKIVDTAQVECMYDSQPQCSRGEYRQESPLRRPDEILTHIFDARAKKDSAFTNNVMPKGHLGKVISLMLQDDEVKKAMGDGGMSQQQINGKAIAYLLQVTEAEEKSKLEKCRFCYPNVEIVTPEPRIKYDGLLIPEFGNVISFPNLFPFDRDHKLIIFTSHKISLNELNFRDMVNYFEGIYEMAKFYRDNYGGMACFMNWGPDAAASQEHPHIQTTGIKAQNYFRHTGMGREFEVCTQLREQYSKNPYEIFMDIMRKSPCFIFENGEIFAYAGFAPRHPDEVDVIFKGVSNILELDTPERRRIAAESVLGVFHALYNKRNVTSLNVVLHQSPFGVTYNDTCFQMHLHMIPRNKNHHGGGEKGRCFNVVDTYPEQTAAALRAHYSH